MNDQLIKHTVMVSDAMFGKVTLAKPTTNETIELAKKLEKSLTSLSHRYTDNRGNLEESIRNIQDIVLNLEGHQRDIQEGKE